MTIVEQLTLDFSAPDAGPDKVQDASSNVLSLDLVRRAKLDKNLQNAYREIFDSVKHVRLRRDGHHENETSSSFG